MPHGRDEGGGTLWKLIFYVFIKKITKQMFGTKKETEEKEQEREREKRNGAIL